MASIIKSHSIKVVNKDVKELKPCNFRENSECPLNGQYQVTDIIYKCTVISPNKWSKVYLGAAEVHTHTHTHTPHTHTRTHAHTHTHIYILGEDIPESTQTCVWMLTAEQVVVN